MKKNIIDSLENWIELRDIRNKLEHDYPEELQEALDELLYNEIRQNNIKLNF